MPEPRPDIEGLLRCAKCPHTHVSSEHHDALEYALRLERENEVLRAARRNQRGDALCWITDELAAKALPLSEFIESCRRFHSQIAGERGVAVGCLTIAQLEARVAELEDNKKHLDAVARALHPHWPADDAHTYIPDQLAGMVTILREALLRNRQGYLNILELRVSSSHPKYGKRYGDLTREEIEGVIAEIDAALAGVPHAD